MKHLVVLHFLFIKDENLSNQNRFIFINKVYKFENQNLDENLKD